VAWTSPRPQKWPDLSTAKPLPLKRKPSQENEGRNLIRRKGGDGKRTLLLCMQLYLKLLNKSKVFRRPPASAHLPPQPPPALAMFKPSYILREIEVQSGAPMSPDLFAFHVRITGKVQGVSYRAWTRDQAVQLGLTGLVRNEGDGSGPSLSLERRRQRR